MLLDVVIRWSLLQAALPLPHVPLRLSALLQARGSLPGRSPLSTPHRTYGDQPPTTQRKGKVSSSQSSLLLPSHAHSVVTHYFNSVARCRRDVPGALFSAGVLVRPVWTAHCSFRTTQLVLTTSLRRRDQEIHLDRSHPTCSST